MQKVHQKKVRHLGGVRRFAPQPFGRPGGVSGAAGGSFRGVEILVKLVEFGIGQNVLVILIGAD